MLHVSAVYLPIVAIKGMVVAIKGRRQVAQLLTELSCLQPGGAPDAWTAQLEKP